MKVILAVGHSKVESTIEDQLPSHCEVVGIATYREAILNKLRENPGTDVVLIRDNLQGEIKILTLIHHIRAEFPRCRIILMTKNREAGDPFLSAVVSYAVWDIILGYKVSVSHMVDFILNPRTFKDVERFQKRVMIDENTPTPEPVSRTTPTSSTTPIREEKTPQEASNDSKQSFPTDTTQSSSTPTPYGETSLSINEPVEVRKGSMREQLLRQIEPTTHQTTQFVSQPERSFSFEPPVESPLSFEQPVETPLSFESPVAPMTLESEPSAPTFVFDQPVSTPQMPTYSQPEIPVAAAPSFVLEEAPTMEAAPLPKFEFNAAKPKDFEEEVKPKESKRAKLFSTKDIESIEKPLVGHRPAFNNKIKNSPVVMSLVGFKGGVGTSQTAFNLAVHLAKHQNKVLYVELNDHSLPLTYLYDLSSLRGGLEEALRIANSSNSDDFSPYITRFKELKQMQRDKDMQILLKPYPDTLDFLTFSHFFVFGEKENYHPEELRGILSSLLLSEGYQYIILDINFHSHPVLVSQALRSSKYICPVITQDMVSIGQSVECLKMIHQNQFALGNKVQFILNRYDSTCNGDKSVLRWINHELPFKAMGIWTIPEATHAYNKANDKSKPVVLASPPKPVAQAFETLHNYLKTM